MVLPYLTPKINPPPRFANIGFDTRNYINPNILENVHAINGKFTKDELQSNYTSGNAKLKSAPAYGVTQAAQIIIDANPNIDVYSGSIGNEMLADESPTIKGAHGRRLNPLDDETDYITLIRDDLNNLGALQTLNHETGHYRMGHSTPLGSVAMPESINGRNNTDKALKEIEAESVAAATMNRLGYGYAPGLVDRSSSYIARWYNDLPRQWQTPVLTDRVNNRANELATQLVPEPIRRFGPISTRIANLAF